MLLALRHYSDLVGKPLHACAAELIERGLDRPQQLDRQQQKEKQHAPVLENVPPHNRVYSESSQPIPALEKNQGGLAAGQMDLFGG
jgi:hypothetical protein